MPTFGRKSEVRIPKSETSWMGAIWKNKANFIVRCSTFRVQRQDEEKAIWKNKANVKIGKLVQVQW
jgi:hypothetical protein